MPTQTKPSIVFAHGLWADGSCFSKVIPVLQADGYEAMSTQNSLDSLKGDVEAVTRVLGRVSSPAILVGHSYGGTVITAAGNDDRVVGLVYIAALAPDDDETSQSLQDKFPKTDVFDRIEIADGRVWLRPDGVAKKDRTVHPDLERFCAKRMRAATTEVDSSHVPMLSHPTGSRHARMVAFPGRRIRFPFHGHQRTSENPDWRGVSDRRSVAARVQAPFWRHDARE